MGRDAIVAGTGFEGRAEIIRRHVRPGMTAHLIREPSHPHDPNAVAVIIHVPRLFGLFGQRPAQIGYIKSAAAKSVAKKMDAGTKITGSITSFYAPDGMEHPRVSLRLEWPDA